MLGGRRSHKVKPGKIRRSDVTREKREAFFKQASEEAEAKLERYLRQILFKEKDRSRKFASCGALRKKTYLR